MTGTTNPTVAAGIAAAEALAPTVGGLAGGATGALAGQLLAQGLAFWADYSAKLAAGTLTMADVETAAAKTNVDLAQLQADVAAQG